MPIFDYLTDSEYRQRRDLHAAKDATAALSATVDGVADDVAALKHDVREVTALVHVLVGLLQERGQIDLEVVRARLKDELTQLHASRSVPGAKATHDAPCVQCGKVGDKMVRVGADLWCRACSANP